LLIYGQEVKMKGYLSVVARVTLALVLLAAMLPAEVAFGQTLTPDTPEPAKPVYQPIDLAEPAVPASFIWTINDGECDTYSVDSDQNGLPNSYIELCVTRIYLGASFNVDVWFCNMPCDPTALIYSRTIEVFPGEPIEETNSLPRMVYLDASLGVVFTAEMTNKEELTTNFTVYNQQGMRVYIYVNDFTGPDDPYTDVMLRVWQATDETVPLDKARVEIYGCYWPCSEEDLELWFTHDLAPGETLAENYQFPALRGLTPGSFFVESQSPWDRSLTPVERPALPDCSLGKCVYLPLAIR